MKRRHQHAAGTKPATSPGFTPALLASTISGILAAAGAQAQDQDTQAAPPPTELEEIVVTGYRRSLEDAAIAKRENLNFTDTIFAEDIGKFPDLNIAESLNRIPGVQLARDINGEGLNIAIRGLGTTFTKVVMNGSQIAVASTGPTDATNQNRELDLDLFPTELFTKLEVSKTQRASMLEGGASGLVNMRTARPFDNPGTNFNYQLQNGYGEASGKFSPRGGLTASWTNDTFGVLAGAAAVSNKAETSGFETIGWTNPTVTHGQCGTTPDATKNENLGSVSPQCNSTGGNGFGFPGVPSGAATTGIGVVPTNPGGGLTAGTTIDRAFLESINPGLTLEQIGNALIPRLGRPHYAAGERDRIAGLVSLEYRPTDNMRFYLDTFYADAHREFDRLDMNLVGRGGNIIPMNMQLDANNVVQSATFANAQFFLEARPYDEQVDFTNLNPGMRYEFSDTMALDFQLNKTRSKFFRESPTVLVNTPLNQGLTVQYANLGGNFPSITTNFDLNDPSIGWNWSTNPTAGQGARVNIQNERRDSTTEGAHVDFSMGADELNFVVGAAYDDVERTIVAYDASRQWQQVVCGGGGTFIPAPQAAPPCTGGPGSAIPNGALASYLMPGPAGFITVDFDRFFADTNYYALAANAPVAVNANTSARSGGVREETTGGYFEVNGEREIYAHMLRFNAGARYITTDQTISGPVFVQGVLQPGPWAMAASDYNKVLPSTNLAYNLTNDVILRASASRTLTRPDPSAMIPAVQFSDQSARNATAGNPTLSPYLSNNIDLGGEWYTGGEGFIGLTLFQKKIDGFTVNQGVDVPFRSLGIAFEALTDQQQTALNSRGGPDSATVTLQRQVNADGELTIKGYEVTYVQPLGRFNPMLDGFGVNLNYTRVTQKGEGTGAPAQAIGISPHAYNATAYYDKRNASVRLSWTWSDEQINSQPNEQGIPLAQRYVDAYGQLDLSASYEFTNLPTSPAVTLNVINITSETLRSTFQFDNATFTYYDPGYQVLLGVRGKF